MNTAQSDAEPARRLRPPFGRGRPVMRSCCESAPVTAHRRPLARLREADRLRSVAAHYGASMREAVGRPESPPEPPGGSRPAGRREAGRL